MLVVFCIVIFPFAVLSELMKMNNAVVAVEGGDGNDYI